LARSSPIILTQYHPLTTESIAASEASSIVAGQRKNRPISPHLRIYKIQITSAGSILNRITGAVLSGGIAPSANKLTTGIYVFGAAYLVSPLLGWHLDVPTMTTAFGSLPIAAKLGIKTAIALPFSYHSINGLRHLLWDTGAGIPFSEMAIDYSIG
jgi:succinate dehydrogenase (ubiquinone) cytochrome b560 subunit